MTTRYKLVVFCLLALLVIACRGYLDDTAGAIPAAAPTQEPEVQKPEQGREEMEQFIAEIPDSRKLSIDADTVAWAAYVEFGQHYGEPGGDIPPSRRIVRIYHLPTGSSVDLDSSGTVVNTQVTDPAGDQRLDAVLKDARLMTRVMTLLGKLPAETEGVHTVAEALELLDDSPESLRDKEVKILAYLLTPGSSMRHGPAPTPGYEPLPCERLPRSGLADFQFHFMSRALNGISVSPLREQLPFIRVASGIEDNGQSALPLSAVFRGHFFDEAYEDCSTGYRVFTITGVEEKLADRPEPDFRTSREEWLELAQGWKVFSGQGMSLDYPPEWTVRGVEPSAGYVAEFLFQSPTLPHRQVRLSVLGEEAYFDPWVSFSEQHPVYREAKGIGIFPEAVAPAWVVDSRGESIMDITSVSVVMPASGKTYELSTEYSRGPISPQPLLDVYSVMAYSIRLDKPPGPTPVLTNIELGPGPFISRQEAESTALLMVDSETDRKQARIISAELLSEYDARQSGGHNACSTFQGHRDGVWVVIAYGLYQEDAPPMDYVVFIDAVSGERLCASPWDEREQPERSNPTPGSTSTPVPERGL